MGIGSLSKKKASKVLGIDTSTNSLAFALFENGTPVICGEIFFEGSTPFDRVKDAKKKVKALVENNLLIADYIAIESAIMVRNIQTAIDMAYMVGAIVGELSMMNPEIHRIPPITWQSGIGNPNLKKHEKDQIKQDFPGKSKTWYSNKGRLIRKQRTMDIARQHFNIPSNSDNIGDAIGIALYASKALTRSA